MRYAYWRRPDTSLHKADDERHAPTALLHEIGTRATVNADNSISWPMSQLHEFQVAANSSIAILQPDDTELNEIDSNDIVEHSLYELIRREGSNKAVHPKKLLELIDRTAATFFRESSQERLLVTSLSIDNQHAFAADVFGIQISNTDRRTFPFLSSLIEMESYVSSHIKKTRYAAIAVRTNEISANQAFECGMTATNCLRGIWNLLATFRASGWSWSVVPKRKWIGAIHVGPVHTMHNPDGSSLSDLYWYEPDYVEDGDLFKPGQGWPKFELKRQMLFDQIAISPFKSDLIRLLARYTIALDQSNLDVAFLMLWSLLEKITNTVGGNYDTTIERAVWPFTDRAVSKQLLNQMRLRRNQFVHSAGSSNERDQLCRITKSFVDAHLLALIQNRYSVNSMSEYGDFLGLPHNSERLKQMRDWYQRAYDFQVKSETPGTLS